MLISDWSSDVCSSDLLGDAGDLRLVIAHRIETLAQALVGFPEPARLPEIDVARQFANDDQIDRPRDFRTQGGRIGKLGEKLCRPQVREQPQLFAELQDRLLGPQMPFQPVAIRIAPSAEQGRIRAPGNVQRRLERKSGGEGKGLSVRVDLGGRRLLKKKKKAKT